MGSLLPRQVLRWSHDATLKEVGSSSARAEEFGDEDSNNDEGNNTPIAQWHVITSVGGTGEGDDEDDEKKEDDDDEEEELAKTPRAYVTKTHGAFIILALAAAHKEQHAHDLPAVESLATWTPEVVQRVVVMCRAKFPAKKEVFTEASVLRKYNGTRQRARGGKSRGRGGGQGPKGGKRLVVKQAKAARAEATVQRIALREAREREAAEEHVTWMMGCRKSLHKVTSGAGRSLLRRILDADDHGCVAFTDDEPMMTAAYDELTTLYGQLAKRENVVGGAQALGRDTFGLWRAIRLGSGARYVWATGEASGRCARAGVGAGAPQSAAGLRW